MPSCFRRAVAELFLKKATSYDAMDNRAMSNKMGEEPLLGEDGFDPSANDDLALNRHCLFIVSEFCFAIFVE